MGQDGPQTSPLPCHPSRSCHPGTCSRRAPLGRRPQAGSGPPPTPSTHPRSVNTGPALPQWPLPSPGLGPCSPCGHGPPHECSILPPRSPGLLRLAGCLGGGGEAPTDPGRAPGALRAGSQSSLSQEQKARHVQNGSTVAKDEPTALGAASLGNSPSALPPPGRVSLGDNRGLGLVPHSGRLFPRNPAQKQRKPGVRMEGRGPGEGGSWATSPNGGISWERGSPRLTLGPCGLAPGGQKLPPVGGGCGSGLRSPSALTPGTPHTVSLFFNT